MADKTCRNPRYCNRVILFAIECHRLTHRILWLVLCCHTKTEHVRLGSQLCVSLELDQGSVQDIKIEHNDLPVVRFAVYCGAAIENRKDVKPDLSGMQSARLLQMRCCLLDGQQGIPSLGRKV